MAAARPSRRSVIGLGRRGTGRRPPAFPGSSRRLPHRCAPAGSRSASVGLESAPPSGARVGLELGDGSTHLVRDRNSLAFSPTNSFSGELPPSWDSVATPKFDMETKGSNTVQSSSSTVGKKRKSPKQGKKKSPKQRKKKSPQGAKPRAQWNILLEKSLVEILHEHDTPYHRGQNGWSGESWSAMVDMFHQRNPHVRFDKSQVHDKEKELERDYRMLKDALGQSGVGWIDSKFMLDAEPHLWDNLAISFGPRILRFKKKPFPLYETLANLYHKHTAEGNFNFTSTADQKPHMDIETDSDDDEEDKDADFEILEQPHVEHVQVNQRQVGLEHVVATQTQASVTNVEANQRNGAGPSTNKPRRRKSSPKMKPKSTGDALVGVIDRFVNIKEKEVNNEAAQQFTISKCIATLRTLQGFDPAEKPKAFVVFKSVDNREIFLSSVEDNDGSALAWLRGEMAKLP